MPAADDVAPARPVAPGEGRGEAAAFFAQRVDELPQRGLAQQIPGQEDAEIALRLAVLPGHPARQLVFEHDRVLLQPGLLAEHALDARGDLLLRHAQEPRGRARALQAAAVIVQRVHAAHDREAHAAPVPFGREDLDQPDLAGARYVRRAAGAEVDALDLHQAHRARQLLLAAVVERRELLRGGIPGADRQVRAHGLVGQGLDPPELLLVQLAAEVDGHALGAHMEADVVVAVEPVRDAGEDVLAGVVLHPAQALFGVDPPDHFRPGLDRAVGAVQDAPLALVHVRHARLAEDPGVGALPAALGEEGRAVELDQEALFVRLAGEHLRAEGEELRVFVIQPFRRHITAPG